MPDGRPGQCDPNAAANLAAQTLAGVETVLHIAIVMGVLTTDLVGYHSTQSHIVTFLGSETTSATTTTKMTVRGTIVRSEVCNAWRFCLG